jgi:hypothetical protein
MRTKLWALVLAAAVLGFVLGGILVFLRPASTSAAAISVEITHLQFLVKFIGQDTTIDLGSDDLGAPGPSQGDEMVLRDLVFTPDGSKQVGYDGGSCVFFDVAKPEENCTVTFSLPGGDIMTQFLNSPQPAKTFAVTGGTGIYRNMRGQGELRARGVGRIGSRDRDPQIRPDWVRAASRHRTTIARAVPADVALSQNALEGAPNLNWHLPGIVSCVNFLFTQ